METLGKLRNKILFSVVIGAVVVLVLGVLGEVDKVGEQIGRFRWSLLPAIVGLIVFNYSLRWLKWDFYLRRLRMGQGVSRGQSALIFLAGMVMAITPGKVGEVLKSALLKQVNGTPVSASAPIVLAERITDGLAMLLLMGLGLSLYAPARLAFVALVALSALAIGIAQHRALSLRIISWAARLPLVGRFAPHLHSFYESSALLLSWRVLLVSTLISLISWGGECLAFFVILVGLGEHGSLLLLQQATFIYAASTLFGLVSFLPGGLGVSEASSATLLGTIIGMPRAAAVTATIFIRLCTLWFGVSLGIVALLLFTHRHGASNGAADLPVEPA